MSALRRPVSFLLVGACSIMFSLLSGCGSNHINVCPLGAPVSGTGLNCCGPTDACPAEIFLFADGTNGQVSAFSVSLNGTPVPIASISGPTGSLGMAALGNSVYASNPNSPSMLGGSIDGWSFSASPGQLTALSGSPFSLPMSVPGELAANSNAQVIYVADAGKIDALQMNSAGTLTALPGSPFSAGTGIGVTIDSADRFVYSTDTTPPGNVWAFTTNSAGALTAVAGSPYALGTNLSASVNPSQIVVDQSGKFVFVALSATNRVAVFSIDQTSGALTAVPGSPFATGNDPVGMATINNLLYVSNTTDGTLSSYTFDPTSGVLTPAAGSPFPINASALVSSFGIYLYASTAQGIATYSVNSSTGALTQVDSPVSSPPASVLTFAF